MAVFLFPKKMLDATMIIGNIIVIIDPYIKLCDNFANKKCVDVPTLIP